MNRILELCLMNNLELSINNPKGLKDGSELHVTFTRKKDLCNYSFILSAEEIIRMGKDSDLEGRIYEKVADAFHIGIKKDISTLCDMYPPVTSDSRIEQIFRRAGVLWYDDPIEYKRTFLSTDVKSPITNEEELLITDWLCMNGTNLNIEFKVEGDLR